MWPLGQMNIKLIKLIEIPFKFIQVTSSQMGWKTSIFIQNQCINLYDFVMFFPALLVGHFNETHRSYRTYNQYLSKMLFE